MSEENVLGKIWPLKVYSNLNSIFHILLNIQSHETNITICVTISSVVQLSL